MSRKIMSIPELGEITLSKRRGARNLRLSITPAGKLRVSMPVWIPYSTGLSFAIKRRDWIKKQRGEETNRRLRHGSRVGKSYRIDYAFKPDGESVTARVVPGAVKISAPLPIYHPAVQAKAAQASENALRREAATLLPPRLADLARQAGYNFKDVRVRKLTSRWGSCSSQNVITLNYYLVQLPWPLIDYVLLHELIHTRHLNHSPDFWSEFESIYPGAKRFRRRLRAYRPVLNAID